MFQAGFLWWIVDRSPGQKHSLCLCCILVSDFPSQGKEVLLWKGRPGSPTQGRGGGPDTVLLRMFLAGDDQQYTLNQCKAARTSSQRDAAACLSWWRTCMSHGNVPSLRTISPADGQQAPWRSCCTTGLRAQLQQPLVLVLMLRTVPSSRGSALCRPLWGAGRTPSPPSCLEGAGGRRGML